MNALQKSQRILIGLAIGVVLALLIAPETGWIARNQIGTVTLIHPMHLAIGIKNETPAVTLYRPIAEKNPNDYQIQLAYTTIKGWDGYTGSYLNFPQNGDPRVACLRALIPRFGDNPSLYANILRFSTADELRTGDRPENYLLSGQQPPSASAEPQLWDQISSEKVLLAFDQDAATGERLDPNNAYFPVMRSIGLFAQKRDDDAIAAILQAGKDTQFDDYSPDQVEGEWKLNEALIGGKLSISRLAIAASLLFPHYAKMREMARIAAYKAILLEQGGKTEQGLALRNALMRIGSLMRAQSHSVIGSLVGIAITRIGMDRPGGGPHVKAPSNESAAEIERGHIELFCAYLARIGHADEIPWVRSESAAGDQVQGLLPSGASDQILNMPVRAAAWWVVDLLALCCAFWLLILALAANLLSRIRAVQSGEPLSAPAGRGVASACIIPAAAIYELFNILNGQGTWFIVGLVVLLYVVLIVRGFRTSIARGILVTLLFPFAFFIIWAAFTEWLFDSVIFLSLVTAAVPVFLVWSLIPQRSRSDQPQPEKKPLLRMVKSLNIRKGDIPAFFAGFGITLGAIALALGFIWIQMRPALNLIPLLGALVGTEQIGFTVHFISAGVIVAIVVLLILAVLPAAIALIARLVGKTPLSALLTRAYRLSAVPIASVILIGYGALVLITVQSERAANYVQVQFLHHEGEYYSIEEGLPWPGATASQVVGQ